jgi:hypothetical protein
MKPESRSSDFLIRSFSPNSTQFRVEKNVGREIQPDSTSHLERARLGVGRPRRESDEKGDLSFGAVENQSLAPGSPSRSLETPKFRQIQLSPIKRLRPAACSLWPQFCGHLRPFAGESFFLRGKPPG